MARQWFLPSPEGGQIDEDGTEEYFVPSVGQINEDQAVGGSFPPWKPPITHLLAR